MRALAMIGFVGAALAAGPAAAELSAQERAIVERVDANFADSLSFLERSVNISSDTMNPAGVRAAGAQFEEPFAAIGFSVEWVDLPAELERAGHLVASRKGEAGNRILMIGHLDTVFPETDPPARFRREEGRAFGPGVADMKGGNVAILYALRALHEAGALDGAGVEVVLTGDEEKPGKPVDVSRARLIEAAQRADVALGFEGAEEGVAVTARRGSSGWRLTTTGLTRHSSGIFSDGVGAGAVFEAARILNAFYEELRGEDYLTFNPGIVVGGTDVAYDPEATRGTAFGKTNVVAQKVVVDGGLRFITEDQKERARENMRAIVARHLPQTGAQIEFFDSYPAMPPTEANAALAAVLSDVSEDLGFGPVVGNDPGKRGAADISFAAPHVPASMGGLGVRGEGAHAPGESMEIESLRDATKSAAILIYRLTREDAPKF